MQARCERSGTAPERCERAAPMRNDPRSVVRTEDRPGVAGSMDDMDDFDDV